MRTDSRGAARRSKRLSRLEWSAMQAVREAVSGCRRPAMLFSAGKDSCVMLHLALRAFSPSIPPFPLLNVDTTWKFPETYPFRDRVAEAAGMTLIVQVNREGARRGVGPFTHGAAEHTRIMKSAALKAAVDAHSFDAVIDGARGDEERFRKRSRMHTSGLRAPAASPVSGNSAPRRFFPLADWTERDVWRYIALENIEVPGLYFAAPRPVVERDGVLIVRVDNRMPLNDGEEPEMRSVRFRTLGCWPLTGALESQAADIPALLRELRRPGPSERRARLHDQAEGPGANGREGYF